MNVAAEISMLKAEVQSIRRLLGEYGYTATEAKENAASLRLDVDRLTAGVEAALGASVVPPKVEDEDRDELPESVIAEQADNYEADAPRLI